jgi:hypothetical protein
MKSILQNTIILLLILTITGILQGCSGDVWMKKDAAQSKKDQSKSPEEMTFADVPPVIETTLDYNFTTRSWPERTAYYQCGAVKHPTLYLYGPYETRGSADGHYRTVDADSYLATAASPVIFIANVALSPIAAILNPPWETEQNREISPLEPMHEIPVFRSQMIDKKPISP